MLYFDYSEKGLGLISPPHFAYFLKEMFLMLHSINWPNFIVWLPLLLEILGNMYITIVVKGELYSNYIFLHFALIGLEWESITLFTKMNFFLLPKLTLLHHLHKIYMAFYLLTWTYFNNVNGGRNTLINSQLKRIRFMSSDKKKRTKLRKTEKTWKNKITALKVTSVKMRCQI